MLSRYGKTQWLAILAIGVVIAALLLIKAWWLPAGLVILAVLALLSFFRDPRRRVPTQKGVMVSPADGRISSIHHLDQFEPLGGPATCIRIFLSVLNVHVNRSPCHGRIASITPKPGVYLNALNPKSAEVNQSNLIVLAHPVRKHPIAAVRQVSGLLARTIVCDAKPGQIWQRGQRFGMIKFGSTTELYVPDALRPEILVRQGQHVNGGQTLMVRVQSVSAQDVDAEAASDSASIAAEP